MYSNADTTALNHEAEDRTLYSKCRCVVPASDWIWEAMLLFPAKSDMNMRIKTAVDFCHTCHMYPKHKQAAAIT